VPVGVYCCRQRGKRGFWGESVRGVLCTLSAWVLPSFVVRVRAGWEVALPSGGGVAFWDARDSLVRSLGPSRDDLDAPSQEQREGRERHTLKSVFHGGSSHPCPRRLVAPKKRSEAVDRRSVKGLVLKAPRSLRDMTCPTLAGSRHGVIRFQYPRKISAILFRHTLAPIVIRTAQET
jgi:hypothetical protein